MEDILNNVPSWVTWVFSGIGCLLLTWLGARFCKNDQKSNTKTSKKSSIKGDNNTAIQGSDYSTINIGK